MLALVMFGLVSTASATPTSTQCSDVKPVDTFNMDKLVGGVWYENARYPIIWEEHAECTRVKYERDGNKYNFFLSEVLENNHKLRNYSGVVEYVGHDKSGVIKITSSIFSVTGSTDFTTSIVDFEYDHYMICFECKYDPINKVDVDHAWIISRSTTLEPHAKGKLEAFLATTKLDVNKIIWDRFGEKDCSHIN